MNGVGKLTAIEHVDQMQAKPHAQACVGKCRARWREGHAQASGRYANAGARHAHIKVVVSANTWVMAAGMFLSLSLSRVLVAATYPNPIICTRHRTTRASFRKQGQDKHVQACAQGHHKHNTRALAVACLGQRCPLLGSTASEKYDPPQW